MLSELRGLVEYEIYCRLKRDESSKEWYRISSGMRNGEIRVTVGNPTLGTIER